MSPLLPQNSRACHSASSCPALCAGDALGERAAASRTRRERAPAREESLFRQPATQSIRKTPHCPKGAHGHAVSASVLRRSAHLPRAVQRGQNDICSRICYLPDKENRDGESRCESSQSDYIRLKRVGNWRGGWNGHPTTFSSATATHEALTPSYCFNPITWYTISGVERPFTCSGGSSTTSTTSSTCR